MVPSIYIVLRTTVSTLTSHGNRTFLLILEYAETDACEKRITETKDYILSNWMAAKIRLRDRETVIGSSTECHVSHVLSSRMSSRPMGWSRTGCDKMSHLRAYYMNKGDMLELVRSQPKTLAKAAGAESDYEVFSMAKIKYCHWQGKGYIVCCIYRKEKCYSANFGTTYYSIRKEALL